MKRISFIIATAITVACLSDVKAQNIVKDAIAVNGLKVGTHYTQQQFIDKLGQPTKIQNPRMEDSYEGCYTYYYKNDSFYLIDGEFYGFELRSPAFQVNGLLRVGDNISKIDQLGGIKTHDNTTQVRMIDWRPSKDGLYAWASVCCYYDSNNIITMIIVFINDL